MRTIKSIVTDKLIRPSRVVKARAEVRSIRGPDGLWNWNAARIGELSFALWLTGKGVNVARRQEMAERSISRQRRTASRHRQRGALPLRW
ncbi:MAG TPA: hypothetical protein VKE96_33035 [Vicinamibacterales bacterium]|nr:hypothetical protein [Vicinamibacterales bacterium]